MKQRLAIIEGIRTPFCKAGGRMQALQADDLGAIAVKELMVRTRFPAGELDEVIFGNVAQPVHAANIARVIALKSDLPPGLIAHSVQRNCASGMQAVSAAADRIGAGEAEVILAGGAESMSNIPLLYGPEMTRFFGRLFKARTVGARVQALLTFRLRHLRPIIGVEQGLTDPICGMNMGQTAEVLARAFHVTREEQDAYALMSHQRAAAAIAAGLLKEEIVPLPLPPDFKETQFDDDGVRGGQTLEALSRLKPYFDRQAGSVTVGNACSLTDGAVALLLMSENRCRAMGLSPLGYLRDYAYAALEGRSMGLGPVYATARLLDKTGLRLADFERIELNEAFAAQVLACERAFASDDFARKQLGRERALGALDRAKLNVNGGAVALGHPVGATGARLILTLLKELRRRKLRRGLATLCIGGGQGAAFALETE